MSYTLRVKGYAYEQKLVGFKDANRFNGLRKYKKEIKEIVNG
jgi:hypothetical protein